MSLPRVDRIPQRLRAAIGQRLLLGLAPSLLALGLVIALAYYGEIGREAPEFVVAGAASLAVMSLALTWWNTRYLVGRLRRLGRSDTGGTTASRDLDELDRIEREVARLNDALMTLTRERAEEAERFAKQLGEQATMLAATSRGVAAQVDDVRLPLHILLDARFGELNENQEELLSAARSAADGMDAALRRLSMVADADRDALVVRPEFVSLNDIVRAILPMVRASADRRGTRIDVALEPALPRVWANRAALAEAIALIATMAVERVGEGQGLTIGTTPSARECTMHVGPAALSLLDEPLVIAAQRVLRVQGASLRAVGHAIEIVLPRAPAAPSRDHS
ncbi:MAG: hypothetical protein IPP90_05025 [Gemmatimonadaceae bacterium]|nr:hypothetical protein [Gemmatimonadaceae bacterium]